ncbi:acetoin utilization AcuB family protein [soil metagenome]
MLVKHFMTRDPVTLGPDDSLAKAMEITRTRRIRHLPVVAGGDRLAGISSDRDIRSATPFPLGLDEPEGTTSWERTPVAAVMTREVITVTPNEPIEDAAHLLCKHRIGSLPVVDGEGRLQGIVTHTDLLRALIHTLGGSEPSSRIEVALPDEPGELARAMRVVGEDLGINIATIVVPALQGDKRKIAILHLNTIDPRPAIEGLEAAGFQVGWPSLDADLRAASRW